MRLVYSQEALADLVRLRDFIAEHNPAAAMRIAHDLVERIEHLREFPELGRRVAQAPDPEAVRDALIGKYRVRYLVHESSIAILRIWHHFELRNGDS